ncbi:MAG: hypothetical protein GY696_28330 [Gammaproteobacteria bacterium]|nr:hypothetical protein [Gammaproteobacteria bacterium]
MMMEDKCTGYKTKELPGLEGERRRGDMARESAGGRRGAQVDGGCAKAHSEGTSPSQPHYQSRKEDRLGKEIEVTSQSSDNKHRNILLMCVTSSYAYSIDYIVSRVQLRLD